MLRILPASLLRLHWVSRLPLYSRLLYIFLLAHLLDIGVALHLGRLWGHFGEVSLMAAVDLPLTALMTLTVVRSIVRAYSDDR